MQYATATAGTASATDRGKAKPAARWGKIGGAGGLKGVTCDASGELEGNGPVEPAASRTIKYKHVVHCMEM